MKLPVEVRRERRSVSQPLKPLSLSVIRNISSAEPKWRALVPDGQANLLWENLNWTGMRRSCGGLVAHCALIPSAFAGRQSKTIT